MTTPIRARLLAILKEPDRYFWRIHNETLLDVFDSQSTRIGEVSVATGEYLPTQTFCADLNARHRLKRLCEEIAGMSIILDLQPPGTGPFTRENKALEQFRAAILALGEPNEHS